ncbi:hypothetical protein [Arcanobacterium ihumii]|uniref:hypothetical protein n=1 Tax=Arcanobacterium ihumii TaxID=2138162 RepID=UPI001F1DF493|nr:hypothetical protein [Arcanobacterium ihumii]
MSSCSGTHSNDVRGVEPSKPSSSSSRLSESQIQQLLDGIDCTDGIVRSAGGIDRNFSGHVTPIRTPSLQAAVLCSTKESFSVLENRFESESAEAIRHAIGTPKMWQKTIFTGDLDQLAEILHRDDAPRERNCTKEVNYPPNLWVVDDEGDVYRVRWPLDGCLHNAEQGFLNDSFPVQSTAK